MSQYKVRLSEGPDLQEFSNFDARTLLIESACLKGNPLGDPVLRRNPVMIPKGPAPSEGWPVVLVLSGLMGNGNHTFGVKYRQASAPQVIDTCVGRGEAPKAIFAFCDAITYWGGSQFVNSAGTGRYEDYVVNELFEAIRSSTPAIRSRERWCVTGGSSGGYGALHLGSQHPDKFGYVAAIAPDSFFEANIVPDLWLAMPVLDKLGGIEGIKRELDADKFMKRKDAHHVMNAIAMGFCYAPNGRGGVDFPLDRESGLLIEDKWKTWKKHDPVLFMKERSTKVEKLLHVYLDVGTRDQFNLLYGTRQVRDVLRDLRVNCDHSEFDGTHFDIGERRPEAWKWLKEQWG